MKKRAQFTISDDLRMLRWAARNSSQGPKGPSNLWRNYVEHYCSEHTEQSLYGRIRRIILPKIRMYVENLEPSEISKIYRIYGSRLNVEQREYIRKQLLIYRNCRHNRERQLQQRRSNGLNESIANEYRNTSINLNLSGSEHVGVDENVDSMSTSGGKVPENQRIPSACRASSQSHSERSSLKSKTESNVDPSTAGMKGTKQNDPPLKPGTEKNVEKQKKSFCSQNWNMGIKPIAERGAHSIFNLMKSRIDSGSVCQEVLLEAMNKNNMNELFENMFKAEKHKMKQQLVMIGTEDFPVRQLRMQYFQNIERKSKTYSVNDYAYSAVLRFFLYFEFYFVKCTSCYDKNRHKNQFYDFYVHLMNHLVGIITTLMTF